MPNLTWNDRERFDVPDDEIVIIDLVTGIAYQGNINGGKQFRGDMMDEVKFFLTPDPASFCGDLPVVEVSEDDIDAWRNS